MQLIKVNKFGVQKTIQESLDRKQLQLNFYDQYLKNNWNSIIKYVDKNNDKCKIDRLDSWRRKEDSNVKLTDFLGTPTDLILGGFQIDTNPIVKIHPHQKWEGGYFEFFCRFIHGETDRFIWAYFKIDKLQKVLGKYKKHLYFHKY